MPLSLVAVGAKITAAIANSLIGAANANGMTLIVPTSVAGTGVSVTTAGKVIFTAASAISVNGVFSAAYDNYLILLNASNKSADTGLVLRSAGVDSVANYSTERVWTSAAASNPVQALSGTSWTIDANGSSPLTAAEVKLLGPALAASTLLISQATTASPTPSITLINTAGVHTVASAFDGFTVKPGGTALTGTLRVYGFNNG